MSNQKNGSWSVQIDAATVSIIGLIIVGALFGVSEIIKAIRAPSTEQHQEESTNPATEEGQRRENRRETRPIAMTQLKPETEMFRMDFVAYSNLVDSTFCQMDSKYWHGNDMARQQAIRTLDTPDTAESVSVILITRTHLRVEMKSPSFPQLAAIQTILRPVLEGYRLYHDGGWVDQGDNVYHLLLREDLNAT